MAIHHNIGSCCGCTVIILSHSVVCVFSPSTHPLLHHRFTAGVFFSLRKYRGFNREEVRGSNSSPQPPQQWSDLALSMVLKCGEAKRLEPTQYILYIVTATHITLLQFPPSPERTCWHTRFKITHVNWQYSPFSSLLLTPLLLAPFCTFPHYLCLFCPCL